MSGKLQGLSAKSGSVFCFVVLVFFQVGKYRPGYVVTKFERSSPGVESRTFRISSDADSGISGKVERSLPEVEPMKFRLLIRLFNHWQMNDHA